MPVSKTLLESATRELLKVIEEEVDRIEKGDWPHHFCVVMKNGTVYSIEAMSPAQALARQMTSQLYKRDWHKAIERRGVSHTKEGVKLPRIFLKEELREH